MAKDRAKQIEGEEPKKARGRPTIYSPEVVDELVSRMAEGQSLRSICLEDGMPRISAVVRWLTENADFKSRYENAKEIRAEQFAESLIELADTLPERTATGAIDGGSVQHLRLRLDARKWIIAKVLPKQYGDKVTTEVVGKDGESIKIDMTLSPGDAYLKMLGKV